MKKVTTIFLLLCLFLNIFGYHIVFHLRQVQIRTEMKKLPGFSDEVTEQFVFSLSDNSTFEKLEWEGDDEFRLNGIMYDVIEKKTENGKLTIHCINDKKETELIKKYHDITKHDLGNSSKNTSLLLLNLICSLYILPFITSDVLIIRMPETHFNNYTRNISSRSFDVITPPPRFL